MVNLSTAPRMIVLQSQAIHPDWTAQDHLDYIQNDEFIDLATVMHTDDPLALVAHWMQANLDGGHVDKLRNG